MRWRYIIYVVGMLTLSLGLAMTFALVIGLYYGDSSWFPMAVCILITTVCGFSMYISFRGIAIESMSTREGMAIVSFGWILAKAR